MKECHLGNKETTKEYEKLGRGGQGHYEFGNEIGNEYMHEWTRIKKAIRPDGGHDCELK
jgi:formylglycine-generating enzyme required for sulfatase activity